MSPWSPSQSDRLAAAIQISPVGDWYSQHRTSQIPGFDDLILEAPPWAADGAYFSRSAAFFKHNAAVPTVAMAGALDRSTPVGQVDECHFATIRSARQVHSVSIGMPITASAATWNISTVPLAFCGGSKNMCARPTRQAQR
jgi:hypothetical protein